MFSLYPKFLPSKQRIQGDADPGYELGQHCRKCRAAHPCMKTEHKPKIQDHIQERTDGKKYKGNKRFPCRPQKAGKIII